jgi:hypothetical protein
MKMALMVRVPMWSVLRVEVLDFARSFLAFCAIVRLLFVECVDRRRYRQLLEEEGKGRGRVRWEMWMCVDFVMTGFHNAFFAERYADVH